MNPLVGREHALTLLVEHLEATSRGSGGCVVVEGPIGIGRTRLLKEAALEGGERGFAVVSGRASVIDQPSPIRLVIDFLRHMTPSESEFDDLARLHSNPFWLIDRLGEPIENAARARPLLIVLDDVHEADEVGGLALQGLVQSLTASPVLWLLARRPVPAHSLGQQAISWLIDRTAVQLHLEPLDEEAVAALCADVLGAEPDPSALSWAARCGGNPWLLESLLSALIEAGQVVVVDGTASVLADRLPEGFMAAIDHLLDELSPAVRHVLAHAGTVGHTFTIDEATSALGESMADPAAGSDEAIQLGLIRRNGVELGVVHDVIGEALHHLASRGVERTAPGPAPDTEAGQSGPTSAADSDTVRPSPGRGVVTPSEPPRSHTCERDEIVAQAVSALRDQFVEAPRAMARALRLLGGAGRGFEAGRLADVIVRSGIDAAGESRLVLGLAQGLHDAGCHDMSVERLQRTLARQDLAELDRSKLERLLATISPPGGSLEMKAKRINGSASSRDGWASSNARQRIHDRHAGLGSQTVGNGSGSVEDTPAANRLDRDSCEYPHWTWMVRSLAAADHFEEAATLCAAIKRESEMLGEAWPEPLWHGHRADLLMAAGRLDEARVEAEAGLRLGERSSPEDSVLARVVLARISLHGGDLATASEALQEARRLVTHQAAAYKTSLDWALAQFHAASGRAVMAIHTLINVEGQMAPDPLVFAEAPTAAATVVRLARQAALPADAEQATDLARKIAERNPKVASLAGGAEHAEGLLRRDPEALQRAAENYRLGARPLATGVALEDAAKEMADHRHKAQAARLLESALHHYLECGARRDISRVQKKLRRLGAHNVRALGADRPKSGWESLTSAELRVVREIADGKTNRETASLLFLSPHTVDSHLRRVFSKLDINSRVELTKVFIAHE